MGRASKFTDEQKFEIALELLSGKLSRAEIYRKWDISSKYTYKLKDRTVGILRKGIGRPSGRPSGEVEQLRKRVTNLEQLVASGKPLAEDGHGAQNNVSILILCPDISAKTVPGQTRVKHKKRVSYDLSVGKSALPSGHMSRFVVRCPPSGG